MPRLTAGRYLRPTGSGERGQLAWSKCPEAECLPSKTRRVWVARGTRAPLAHIFDAIAGGNPVEEIAEVYELSLQQLVAIVRFAVESAAPLPPNRTESFNYPSR